MYRNKEDAKKYYRQEYKNNPNRKIKILESNKRIKEKNGKFADRYVLLKGCYICGYKKCARALDFHHLDPSTKIDHVSNIIGHYGLEKVKQEIRKCIILCSNCHREFHDGMIKLPV